MSSNLHRARLILAPLVLALAACGGGGGGGDNASNDGQTPTPVPPTPPAPTQGALVTQVPEPVYAGQYAQDKVGVFNRLNADRATCGFGKLTQNAKLDQAAQNHADYLALNKVSTHEENASLPGFTGIGPGQRMGHVGYDFSAGTENLVQINWGSWYATSPYFSVSELKATNNLLGLYASIYHMADLTRSWLDVGIGVANFQYNADGSSNGKPLVLNVAIPASNRVGQLIAGNAVATFPCQGITGLHPAFFSENPNPFPGVDLGKTPYGQPVFITSASGTEVKLTSGTITREGGAAVATVTMTSATDPNKILLKNEVFLVPTARLSDNATYVVELAGTNTGMISATNPTGAWSKKFSFTTGTIFSE